MKSKNIRKILSMILSLSLILQLGIPALYAQEPTVITGFEALEVTEITVPAGTSEEGVLGQLPTTLTVTTDGAIYVDLTREHFTWENETYSPTTKDAEFVFTAKLGDGFYTLDTGAVLPVITVRIGAPEGMTLVQGAVYGGDITNRGLDLSNINKPRPKKVTQYKAGQGHVLFTPSEEG
ncbi:MAG TPA: hypothetical protein GX707_09920, partial [Epulopiscium sp.]|nr:hypothetical protein [Candidatus Epulonipiscium sp.]